MKKQLKRFIKTYIKVNNKSELMVIHVNPNTKTITFGHPKKNESLFTISNDQISLLWKQFESYIKEKNEKFT